MEDSKIIDLYWERNEKAISATGQKYGSYCYYIAYNILHDQEDADESVNDTYLGAWNAIPPHRPNMLRTFLGKITRSISLKNGVMPTGISEAVTKFLLYWMNSRNVSHPIFR